MKIIFFTIFVLTIFLSSKIFCQYDSNVTLNKLLSLNHIVITHITVIDIKNGIELPDRNVEIKNSRIVNVSAGTDKIKKQLEVIQGRGKYLIPGLWDMEVHLSWCKKSSLLLLVANGITNVRDMGSDLMEISNWQNEITNGDLTGPQIVKVGPMLNGKSFNRYQLATGDSAETRGVVRTLKFIGVDGIEIERRVSKSSFKALMDEAKVQKLFVCGHLQLSVTPEEASNEGQNTIDDIESLYYGTFSTGINERDLPMAISNFLVSEKSNTLFSLFAKNHTAVTPVISTLAWIINQNTAGVKPDSNYRYVAKSLRQNNEGVKIDLAELTLLKDELPELRKTVKVMHNNRVMLLAGTDIAGARIPGFSLHAELKEFVDAGLTPMEALQTATINPAIVLGLDKDYGSIEAGKIANLIILNSNPLKNINNTQDIQSVVLSGKLYTREIIDNLLNEVQKMAANE